MNVNNDGLTASGKIYGNNIMIKVRYAPSKYFFLFMAKYVKIIGENAKYE